ncbi:MAG: efflux RND transporter periplasmic adaptor subunit [Aquincola sp.]|nr:efflux RND transporter periplasmic adaptor subunit [Aquincola sp.]MDH5331724.1 efflux RND transporter periplasmic adaptor subunit [Aquincola sp.]
MLLAAGVAAAVAVQSGKLGGRSKDGDDGKPKVTLEFTPREVVAPILASMPTVIEFSGPLVAPQTAVVRARTGGTLLTLTVVEGSRVKAGQLLATIDATELASRLAERQALVESARAATAQAERTHVNNQRLADQRFISPTALDQSRAALDAARAQERAALAQLETMRAVSRDTRIVAPISGIVAKRHAVAGEKVSAEQNIVTIVDLAVLELAGSVGTHEVSQLSAGAPVRVKVEGMEAEVTGKIARIAPTAESGTRSIGVTIELPNPGERLRGGQYALARVELADPQQRLTVPVSAVGNTAGQDHVWLIENGVLARRAVTVGRRDGREGRVELLAGVTPASQVLAARFENLREGAKATVVASKTSAVASAAASTPQVK